MQARKRTGASARLSAALVVAATLLAPAAAFRTGLLPAKAPPPSTSHPAQCTPAGPRVDSPSAPFRAPAPGLLGLPHSRHVRAAQKIQALAQTVAKIKQELNRRDVFKVMAKQLVGSATGLATLMAAGPVPRAYGEGPAVAADKCPNLKEMGKKSREPGFTENLYQGIWYELAYHDVTQANYFCGCTRFNFTIRSDNSIEDMFTTTCPMTGLLPGEEQAKRVYTLNMSITYDTSKPGEFVEKGFQYGFPNVVLYVWTKKGKDGKLYYDRSLQMQCVEAAGKILFVGINFLARAPKVPKKELDEMFDKAKELGIDAYGGSRQGMYLVVHDKCKYPISTDASVMGPRSDFPGPLLGDVEYVTYPDPRIDVYSF